MLAAGVSGSGSRIAIPPVMPSISGFSDRVARFLERVRFKRADTEAELDAILKLRYDAYLKEGAISPSKSGRLEDAFDRGDNVYNIGVLVDGVLASALRIHALDRPGVASPAMESFGDYLTPELSAGKTIIDPNRFVANYELARRCPELPFATVRIGFLAATYFDADIMTMTVRAEHQAFYRRHFFAEEICPPKPYPLLSKPISLLFMDFAKDAQRALDQHPYWASSDAERRSLFGKGPTFAHATNSAVEALA